MLAPTSFKRIKATVAVGISMGLEKIHLILMTRFLLLASSLRHIASFLVQKKAASLSTTCLSERLHRSRLRQRPSKVWARSCKLSSCLLKSQKPESTSTTSWRMAIYTPCPRKTDRFNKSFTRVTRLSLSDHASSTWTSCSLATRTP